MRLDYHASCTRESSVICLYLWGFQSSPMACQAALDVWQTALPGWPDQLSLTWRPCKGLVIGVLAKNSDSLQRRLVQGRLTEYLSSTTLLASCRGVLLQILHSSSAGNLASLNIPSLHCSLVRCRSGPLSGCLQFSCPSNPSKGHANGTIMFVHAAYSCIPAHPLVCFQSVASECADFVSISGVTGFVHPWTAVQLAVKPSRTKEEASGRSVLLTDRCNVMTNEIWNSDFQRVPLVCLVCLAFDISAHPELAYHLPDSMAPARTAPTHARYVQRCTSNDICAAAS